MGGREMRYPWWNSKDDYHQIAERRGTLVFDHQDKGTVLKFEPCPNLDWGNRSFLTFFTSYASVCLVVSIRCWDKGCQACLDRTWGDALEQMLAEHAAQTSVF